MTLTGTKTPDQSGPGSNGYEGVLHTAPEPKNLSFTIRFSLMSYPEPRGLFPL